jgi:hypothetical protein
MRLVAVAVAIALGVAAPAALHAHEHFRIVGVITKLAATEMDVKNKEGKTYTVDINARTVVKRDKDKTELGLSALKAGQTVVVDAYGDDEFDLEALDVRIVPPIGSKGADKPRGLAP